MPTSRQGVSAEALAQHLDVTRQYVAKLVGEGVLAKLADGSFDLDACRVAYIRHLREGRREKTAAESRVRDARAREIELRIAEKERNLIGIDESIACLEDILGMHIADLCALPARVTRDSEWRRKIEAEVDAIRARTSKRLADKCGTLRTGEPTAA